MPEQDTGGGMYFELSPIDDIQMLRISEEIHRARCDAGRAEEEGLIFLRMGYEIDELTLLVDRRTTPWTSHVVPRSMVEGGA